MNAALTYAAAAQRHAELRAAAEAARRTPRRSSRKRRLPLVPRLRRARRAFA